MTLAVCERCGYAGTWWRRLPAYGDAIDEALRDPALAAARRTTAIGRRASSPMASSGCSRSRSRSPPGRKCCCSTSRRPACRKDESAELFAVIANLSHDIAVLFIEHDMNVVFRFANRIIVMVGGRDPGRGHAGRDRRRPARARGLSGRRASWLSRCLRSTMCAPATATRSCSTASRFEVREGGSLALLGRNGVGKSTLLLTIMGYHPGPPRHHPLARPRHHAARRRICGARAASAG